MIFQFKSQRTQLVVILAFAALLLFWRISVRGINEWDEARNGVNAWEMLQNGDYINFYYGGALDSWNAKPPLMIWLINGSYRLFGGNAFALRLPAVLSILGFFVVLYQLLRKSKHQVLALLTCGILLTCKAVVGIHVGLTGDFDALLLLALTASAYFFWRYCYEERKSSIYLTALFTGIAWYVKGPAAFVLLPGFFLAGCIQHGGQRWLKDYRIWLGGLIILFFAASWICILNAWGKSAASAGNGDQSAIRTMFVYDLWQRFTTPNFEGTEAGDYFFFFKAIDVRLNLWNYIFYLSLLFGFYKLWKSKKRFQMFRTAENGMVHFMVCLIVFPVLLITVAASKHDWYLAPVFVAIAYLTAWGIRQLSVYSKAMKMAFAVLFTFLFVRLWLEIDSYARPESFISAEKMKGINTIVTSGNMRQDVYLQMLWTEKPIDTKPVSEFVLSPHTFYVTEAEHINELPEAIRAGGKVVNGYFYFAKN